MSGTPIDSSTTFFTWPDGVLSYECRTCGACCKGLGIGVDAKSGQLSELAEKYPEIATWSRLRGNTWTVFNPRGACWFLDGDGWCRIEREHGRSLKPASCRLFPFNRIFKLGDWTIIDYNSVICPLQAPSADVDEDDVGLSGRVTHESVMAEVNEVEDPAVVGTRLPDHGGIDEWIATERRIGEACFAAEPGSALTAMAGSEEGADAARSSSESAFLAIHERHGALPGPDTLRLACIATPSLRFNEFFGRRSYRDQALLKKLLPGMWWSWLLLLREGAELAGRPLTLQELTSTWSDVADLTIVMALWKSSPWLDPGARELDSNGPEAGRAVRFLQSVVANGRRGETMESLAAPLVGDGTVAERVVRCRLAGPALRQVHLDSPSRGRRRRRRR